jgi:hypothetical protein
MSDEHEDQTLSRVYREGSWPEPNRQIDQAILAASRRAARERHPVLWRWGPSFAIAATVVLTSTLVLKAYREQPEAVTAAAPEKASPAAAKQAAPAAESKPVETVPAVPPAPPPVVTPRGYSQTMDTGEAERVERAQRDLGLRPAPAAGPQVSAVKAAPLLKKPSAETTHSADSLQRRADVPRSPPADAPVSVFGASPAAPAPQPARASKPAQPFTRNAPQAQKPEPPQDQAARAETKAEKPEAAPAAAPTTPPAPVAVPAPAPAQPMAAAPAASGGVTGLAVGAKPAERSPQSWIEDIRKLMSAGKSEEAGREIAEFKTRYPDYALPADLR